MKFSDFLNESSGSKTVVHLFDGGKAQEGSKFKSTDLLAVDGDIDVEFGLKNILKFSLHPVATKDEDPLANEVIGADIEVEFDISGDKDEPEIDVVNKSKVKFVLWDLSKNDLENYDNIEKTLERFEKLLTDSNIKDAAQIVLNKNTSYILKELEKNHSDD